MLRQVLLATAAVGPPALYLMAKGRSAFSNQSAMVSLFLFLGFLFLCLQVYDIMAQSPVARGVKKPRKWTALTAEGVRFVKGLFSKAASQQRSRRLSTDAARGIFGSAAVPLGGSPLFFNNTQNKGELSEAEWVLRWHMAFFLEREETEKVLERLLMETGLKGDAFTGMITHHDTALSEKRKAAATVLQILVFGSKSCGKTSFINSFIDGNREISCHNIEHGPFSHTVTESIYIEDGDLGDNEGSDQVILLRELPAVSGATQVHEQIVELRKAGITAGTSMALILYSPFDADSDEYAESVHAEVSGLKMPHMFLRTKHDLHVAAYGEEDKSYQSDVMYYEPPSKCDDAVVEVVSVKEQSYGAEDEDIMLLHQRVAWAGLNRQLFSCNNHGHREQHWLAFFTMPRIIMLLLFGFLVVREGPRLLQMVMEGEIWHDIQENQHTKRLFDAVANIVEWVGGARQAGGLQEVFNDL